MKIKKIIAITLGVIMLAGVMTGCTEKKVEPGEFENGVTVKAGDPIAIMEIKGFGKVYIALYPDAAPKAVENFTTHAKNGYYDDLTFHRVISDFMIQGGDPSGKGTGGQSMWGEAFEDEFTDKTRNFTGSLSMANSGPNTNGSQFFIVNAPPVTDVLDPITNKVKMTADEVLKQCEEGAREKGYTTTYSKEDIKKYKEIGGTPWLDGFNGYHTPFGQVYKGMDVIKKVMETEVVDQINFKPVKTVTIKSIEITTY